VVRLARAICLAVLVEPGLLRRARIQLVPGADAGTESDLWFSPLVLTRNMTGIVLDPDVVTVLRQQLAADADDPEFAKRARDLIARLHASHPPAVQLEEEVVWEAVRHGNAAIPQIEARLRTAVKAMATDVDGGRDMARWAAQAWWRLPDAATQTDAARLLAVGAALRLGTAASVASFGGQKIPASLGWLTPSDSGMPILLGVELAADGLRFVEPAADGLTLELPQTSPLVLEIGWYDGASSHSEVMTIAPGTDMVLGPTVGQVTLRTLSGQHYIIEPEVVDESIDRIAAGLERERQRDGPQVAPARARFVNQPPVAAPAHFQDRHVESELIGQFLAGDERIMTVVGRGGVGKTAMVCRLLKSLEGGRLPDDGGELDVDGIVYLSPSGAHPVNFPNLFDDMCRLLPEEAAGRLRQAYRDPHQTPTELMRALLDAFPSGRVIVLLDNLEDVIDIEGGDFAITDPALDEALRALLAAPPHGVKVIVTTRVAPKALLLDHPERQRRLDLDEGLGSPYAEQLLRAMDPDGRLGLKAAPDELLDRARERTHGYPRALEALAAILSVDRGTTLPELLDQTAALPGNVVEALVGEAFSRLDPLAQQVMQAVAIYPVPVPPVAVDYLLQPYQPAIDAAQVLSQLVNMHFVYRDAGRYYLHQVDRDYALSRLPEGEPADRDAGPAPFTRQALWYRGAGYFEQTRTPREGWKSLEDLGPQLAEFELRNQGGDYDAAAQVLFGIDFDYLMVWGHYRLAAELHQRLQGHLDDPWTNAASKNTLAGCYLMLGQFTQAIGLFEQALAIARQISDRDAEGTTLGSLGTCYYALGQIPRAIELHEQALAIARETGNRGSETMALGNLADCYSDLGQTERAIDLYEQALAIAREIGDRQGEARHLGNLGDQYSDLGQTERAIDLYEQALAIDRETGYRYSEASDLAGLGEAHGDRGWWDQGARYCRQAIEVADEIGSVQVQSEARIFLARIQLLAGDLAAARQAITGARDHDHPLHRAELSLLSGIIQFRQDEPAAAAREFQEAITQADQQRELSGGGYQVLDIKALALCGLALTTDPASAVEAATAFRAARAVTSADGITRRALALFDALAATDRGGILAPARPAAEGRTIN
jgi:tetratricopeptide (TPR) repeat protein